VASSKKKSSSFPVGIVAKPSEEGVLKLAGKIVSWLEERELECFVGEEIYSELPEKAQKYATSLFRAEFTSKCNPVIVLGGDGTFISAARHPTEEPCTIIGVNMGSLGFLTEIAQEEVFDILERVLASEATLGERRLLKARVFRGGEELHTFFAMNDVVVTKETLARIFAIEVEVDQTAAANLRGDGLICATPGGSTAYSMAAGGSIVHPDVDALLLTPICPHSLTSRPLVVPGSSTVKLGIGESNDMNEPLYLTVDGQEGMELVPGDLVEVVTSSSAYRVARSESRSYYDVLSEKLNWAAGGPGR